MSTILGCPHLYPFKSRDSGSCPVSLLVMLAPWATHRDTNSAAQQRVPAHCSPLPGGQLSTLWGLACYADANGFGQLQLSPSFHGQLVFTFLQEWRESILINSERAGTDTEKDCIPRSQGRNKWKKHWRPGREHLMDSTQALLYFKIPGQQMAQIPRFRWEILAKEINSLSMGRGPNGGAPNCDKQK